MTMRGEKPSERVSEKQIERESGFETKTDGERQRERETELKRVRVA